MIMYRMCAWTTLASYSSKELEEILLILLKNDRIILIVVLQAVSPEEGSAESAGLAQHQRPQEAAQEAEDGEARQPRVQHAGVS